MERYRNETLRLYGVMDERLRDREYLAGDLSVADVATYPWVEVRWFHEIDLENFPNVARWFATLSAREGFRRGAALMKSDEKIGAPTEETREVFFGSRQRTRS